MTNNTGLEEFVIIESYYQAANKVWAEVWGNNVTNKKAKEIITL